MTDDKTVSPARPKACSHCPWRTANQGKPHPHGWYRKSNLLRLWNGIRTGEAPGMTCHPTDPDNVVPEGCKAAPDDGETYECTGALVLVIRELRAFEKDPKVYFKREGPSRRMTRRGMWFWGVQRASGLAGTIMGGEPIPNLEDDPEITVPWRRE